MLHLPSQQRGRGWTCFIFSILCKYKEFHFKNDINHFNCLFVQFQCKAGLVLENYAIHAKGGTLYWVPLPEVAASPASVGTHASAPEAVLPSIPCSPQFALRHGQAPAPTRADQSQPEDQNGWWPQTHGQSSKEKGGEISFAKKIVLKHFFFVFCFCSFLLFFPLSSSFWVFFYFFFFLFNHMKSFILVFKKNWLHHSCRA